MRCRLFSLALCLLSMQGLAANLVEICQDALKSDLIYRQAQANWIIAQQDAPLARAALLPSVTLGFDRDRIRMSSEDSSPSNTFNQREWSINLSQTLFDAAAWKALAQAHYRVKSARAQLAAAVQSVIMRAANQYFDVLVSAEQLSVLRTQLRAAAHQYHQAKARLRAGLVTRMTVLDAKAQADVAQANVWVAQQHVADTRDQLQILTGHTYRTLKGLGRKLPLVAPTPNDSWAWVAQSLAHNYRLKAAKLAQVAAQTGVSVTRAGHLPTVALTGQLLDSDGPRQLSAGFTMRHSRTAKASLGVIFPVFSGGQTVAETKKAQGIYAQAWVQTSQIERELTSQTRQHFRALVSGTHTIKARHKALVSSRAALLANQAAFLAGTRTVVDVLLSLTAYGQAQSAYMQSRYAYLKEVLALKAVSGLLSAEDVHVMTRWLSHTVQLSIV